MTPPATTLDPIAIDDRIRASATTAIADPSAEPAARMRILAHLLDPRLGVVERAVRRFEGGGSEFPSLDRERIADYVTRAFERKVLGTGEGEPLDLERLARMPKPHAWGLQFAHACVRSGVTEVARARRKVAGVRFDDVAATTTPSGPLQIGADMVLSAEEVFLRRERATLVDTVQDIIDTWGESRPRSRYARLQEKAAAVRTLMDLPAPHLASSQHTRVVLAVLRGDDGGRMLRDSLIAFADMASGNPRWEQLSVADELFDLWIDYTAEQAHTLAAANPDAVTLLVEAAAARPPRPGEAHRVAIRRLAKQVTAQSGWPSLVMRLEKAWVAEFFDARTEKDTADQRDDETAEAERAADASLWPVVAQDALEFGDVCPFGPSVRTAEDVAAWLMRAHEVVAQTRTANLAA